GGLRAGIDSVDAVPAVLAVDTEAGAFNQSLDDPVASAVLVADMGGKVGGCEAFSLRLGHARDPVLEFPAMLRQRQGEHDLANERRPSRSRHLIRAEEGDALPEIGQMMEGIIGDKNVGRRSFVLIAEESAAPKFQVA